MTRDKHKAHLLLVALSLYPAWGLHAQAKDTGEQGGEAESVYRCAGTTPRLLYSGGLKPGLHACSASTLVVELHLQPWVPSEH